MLPGWESLENAERIRSWLGVSVVCLLILGAALEIAALVYGSRVKKLSDVAAKGFQRPELHSNPEGQRRLSQDQKTSLAADLKAAGPARLMLSVPESDAEAMIFAGDFRDVFAAAGWNVEEYCESKFEKVPVGIIAGFGVGPNRKANADGTVGVLKGEIPEALKAFIAAMDTIGVRADGMALPDILPGLIEVRIGRREPKS